MSPAVDDIRELEPIRREILYKLIELEAKAPFTPGELLQELPDDLELVETFADYHLRALQTKGLVEYHHPDDPDRAGFDSVVYRPVPDAKYAARNHLRSRLDQVIDDPIEGWSVVIHQREGVTDRVVEGAFCPRCGSVWAGEGICDECEMDVEGDVVADGGWSR